MANIVIRSTRATSSAVVNEGRHPRRSLSTSSPPATTTRAGADTATEQLIENRLAVLRWSRNRGPLWRTTCTTGRIWPRTRPGGPDQGPERQLVPMPDPAPGRHDVGERATFADCVPDGEGSAAGAAQVAQRPGQLVPTGGPLLLVLGVVDSRQCSGRWHSGLSQRCATTSTSMSASKPWDRQ